MKKYLLIISLLPLLVSGCDFLDTKYDTDITTEMVNSDYTRIAQVGQGIYSAVKSGLWELDNNLAAARSDEAVQTTTGLSVSLFNNGSWNDISNPDNYLYDEFYKGIHNAHYFLNFSENYEEKLKYNRDIISDGGAEYRRDVENVAWLRAEAHVALAYYYAELQKRYGEVPLVKEVLEENVFLPKSSYEDVLNYIVEQIDGSLESLRPTWRENYEGVEGDRGRDGRFTVGAALAIKSRALLYAASPLNNPEEDRQKWARAAEAAHDLIKLNMYSLDNDYSNLFLSSNALDSREMILVYRHNPDNSLEKQNYPVGTEGGNSGLTPSENLVEAYEYAGTPNPDNRYENLDPRFYATIVYNGCTWNGRTIDISANGQDSYLKNQASRTGYYLKKFHAPNLFLLKDETECHVWPLFRYAEILLNYAEAMNEAYGPDETNGYTMSAKEALNAIRRRPGVNMPDIETSDPIEFRKAVLHERRIELAFEGHRYWDLVRWQQGDVLSENIRGVRVTNETAPFQYEIIDVEKRVFEVPKMYRYPFPYYEVQRSQGVLVQNVGW